MISELYGWVRGIAVYLIIMSLVIKLLPEESYGKYIRHFMGVLLILVVLAPAIRLFRLDRLLERLERGFSASAGTEQFKDELLLMGEAYEEELIGQYEEALAESAAKELSRNGFEDTAVSVEIDGDPESETFGTVRRATVIAGGGEDETGSIAIRRRQVGVLYEDTYSGRAGAKELQAALARYLEISEGQVTVK